MRACVCVCVSLYIYSYGQIQTYAGGFLMVKLFCVAVRGKTLLCCSALQRVAACCSVLQCVAVCCSVVLSRLSRALLSVEMAFLHVHNSL